MNVLAGKPFAAVLLLATSAFSLASTSSIDGNWEGTATVRGQQVPIHLQFSGSPTALKAALINGPEEAAASSATLKDGKLVVAFNYYARTLEATISGDNQDQLTGTFGLTSTSPKAAPRVPVTLHHVTSAPSPTPGPDIHGDWEIAVSSNKGESAWQLRVAPAKQPPSSTPSSSASTATPARSTAHGMAINTPLATSRRPAPHSTPSPRSPMAHSLSPTSSPLKPRRRSLAISSPVAPPKPARIISPHRPTLPSRRP